MTYLRPSSSRSVNIRKVAAKRDRLHALMPAMQEPIKPLNMTDSNVKYMRTSKKRAGEEVVLRRYSRLACIGTGHL